MSVFRGHHMRIVSRIAEIVLTVLIDVIVRIACIFRNVGIIRIACTFSFVQMECSHIHLPGPPYEDSFTNCREQVGRKELCSHIFAPQMPHGSFATECPFDQTSNL